MWAGVLLDQEGGLSVMGDDGDGENRGEIGKTVDLDGEMESLNTVKLRRME